MPKRKVNGGTKKLDNLIQEFYLAQCLCLVKKIEKIDKLLQEGETNEHLGM